MLRTFSKAYGLAGLRVGYAVGDPEVITALGKVYVPFTSSTISQAAAIASLAAAGELLARTDAVVEERIRVSAELARLGYRVPATQANFVWLPWANRPPISPSVPPRPGYWSGPTPARGPVSIGARDENDAFPWRLPRSGSAANRDSARTPIRPVSVVVASAPQRRDQPWAGSMATSANWSGGPHWSG